MNAINNVMCGSSGTSKIVKFYLNNEQEFTRNLLQYNYKHVRHVPYLTNHSCKASVPIVCHMKFTCKEKRANGSGSAPPTNHASRLVDFHNLMAECV